MTSAKLGVRSSGRKGRGILETFGERGKTGQKLGLMAEIFAPQVRRVWARRAAMCPPPTMRAGLSWRLIIMGKNGGRVINSSFLLSCIYPYFHRECVILRRTYRFVIVLVILMVFAGGSEGVIRDGGIRGKAGLSYGSISYSFGSLSVVIRNRNHHNVDFGGSMIFLDRNYRVIARAELLPGKIKRNSSRQYKGFFSQGSGDEAQRAKYLEWEF